MKSAQTERVVSYLKRAAFWALALGILLGGCEKGPDRFVGLTNREMVQVVVLEAMAEKGVGSPRGTTDSPILFLACSNEQMPEQAAEVSQAVMACIARSFPTVRKLAAVSPSEGPRGQLQEAGTGKRGVKLWVGPLSVQSADVFTAKCGWFSDGLAAEGCEIRVERVDSRWKITELKRIWVS
jgi:hypothetical protein